MADIRNHIVKHHRVRWSTFFAGEETWMLEASCEDFGPRNPVLFETNFLTREGVTDLVRFLNENTVVATWRGSNGQDMVIFQETRNIGLEYAIVDGQLLSVNGGVFYRGEINDWARWTVHNVSRLPVRVQDESELGAYLVLCEGFGLELDQEKSRFTINPGI